MVNKKLSCDHGFLSAVVCLALSIIVQCADVKLGADGRVECPSVYNVYRVIVIFELHSPDEQQIGLYDRGLNYSNDKYIIDGDFSAVIVRNTSISDQGRHRCNIRTDPIESYYKDTTLNVYGKDLLLIYLLCAGHNSPKARIPAQKNCVFSACMMLISEPPSMPRVRALKDNRPVTGQ